MALAKKAMTGGGAKLSISAALPATWDKAGFEALTFTELGNVVNLGDWGKTWNETTFEPVSYPEAQVLVLVELVVRPWMLWHVSQKL